MGLTAAQAIGTGFEGVFSRRPLTAPQRDRVMQLLEFCKDYLIPARSAQKGTATLEVIARTNFARFTPAQQALLLFLRALAGRPPLVILDEPSQGVDEAMWKRCVELLDQEWKERPEMSTVVVSHYEDEVPWGKGHGRVLRLDDGRGEVE
jgi:ABC-type molybdenum transport system ATPase subunit/photorepair protein PhrA